MNNNFNLSAQPSLLPFHFFVLLLFVTSIATTTVATAGEPHDRIAPSVSGEEFLPFDTNTHETVDGRHLVIVAYGVILCLLLGYSASLFARQWKTEKKTLALKNRIESYLNNRSKTQQ